MDDSAKVILKKLDEIDSRLQNLETPGTAVKTEVKKIERDPLFPKAMEMMEKSDEISSKQLSDTLKIDAKRADAILDQLEAAGFGTCYMKEV
jgi:DNA-binding MarR family transcriptional regulator